MQTVISVLPKSNPPVIAHLSRRQNTGLRLWRHLIIQTEPGPSKPAKGVASSRRVFFNRLSMLMVGLVALVTPLRAQFVYVLTPGNNVSAYSIGSKGGLIPVPGSPFAVASGSVSVAVDPTARFVYVANGFFSPVPNTISAFSIGPDGALRPVPGSLFQWELVFLAQWPSIPQAGSSM